MYDWTEDLSVGVETIDSQHREIFRVFNTLLRGAEAASPSEAPWVLGFLEDYVVNHFGLEELYMRRYSYPGYLQHKNEHVSFIEKFYDLRDEFDATGSNPENADRLGRFLGAWLVNHIGRSDRALGEFIRRRDGKPE
ncbi:MAG: bacteriohemerythrin [Thermodesulfobacteriota bacterium]